jgi:signal transduction histidine kinase
VSIYTALTISLSVYYLWTDQIRQQVSVQLQKNTELSAYTINKELTYEKNNLAAWSQLDVMLDLITDDLDKRIINTLKLLKKNYRLPGDLLLINANNQIIATTNDTSAIAYQVDGNTTLFGDLNNNAQIILSVPIYLSIMPDTVSGYLVLTHPWENIVKQLSTPLQEFLVVKSNRIYHFNHARLIETSDQNPNDLLNTYWEMNGQKKIHSNNVSLIKLLSDSINIYGIVNTEEALRPITDTLKLIAMVTILLLIPIIFISVWSSNRFLKPMIELQQAAEEIAESGDLSIIIPIKTKDEIGRLASVLNKMTSKLENSFEENNQSNRELQLLTETLEVRVKGRTLELTQTLDKLKNAQSQLVQSEKMSSLGQLVAGIAHELNNPISSVYVNTPMLKEYVADLISFVDFIMQNPTANEDTLLEQLEQCDYSFLKEDIFELLNAQEDAAKRIKDIVLSLRTFSRLDEAESKKINLNQGIDNTINILRHEIKHRVVIHKDYQLTQDVECFPGEINQVVLNVLANAVQAIEGEGNVWITTRSSENNKAQIIISDDGKGLPQSIIDKIFDPFFTTKAIGVGTGLGLSISYGIINKHHGHILAENISPHGAKFTIEIPLVQEVKS